jgi:D-alanine transaminase
MSNPQGAAKTSTDLAWIEGEIVGAREARIPLWDRGFLFAEAAYEVCIGRGGRIFAWEEHRRRLDRTLEGIAIPEVAATLGRVDQACRELVEAFGAGTFLLYIHVSGGVAPRLHVLPKDPTPAVYAAIRPHDRSNLAREQERGLTAITRPDLRWARATWKTTQLLPNVLAKKDSRAEKADDVIFVDRDGVVLEGAATNVFWVDSGRIRTCPLSRNILPGITRELLPARLGVAVEDVAADLATVQRASEVFMTGTTRDVTAVVRIDGQAIGDGRPGPVARDLGRRFAELFDHDCPPR